MEILYWINKVLYWGTGATLAFCAFVVLLEMVKGTDWQVPFRWICIVYAITCLIDWWISTEYIK